MRRPKGDFLEIRIPPHSVPVSFRGHYYYRTGSTKTELSGASLNEFLHRKSGRTWDASIEERATMDDIDPKSIALYLEDAADTGRLPDARRLNPPELLRKLRLARGDDLTCAALILFGKDPGAFYPGINIRIGRFGTSDTDLQFQEVVEGNLIHCLREATEQLLGKFTIKPIHFEGMRRIETPQYPVEALREVLLNAMVHRRYQSGVHVQIRVYADRLIAWNDGPLPPELSMEGLLGFHTSHPRNPLIAEACFNAGYIDSWGRGIEKIREACTQAGLPEPEFDEFQGGMRVTLFAKSRLESTSTESEGVKSGSEGGSDQSEGAKSGSEGEGPESGAPTGLESGLESRLEAKCTGTEGGKVISTDIARYLDQRYAKTRKGNLRDIVPGWDLAWRYAQDRMSRELEIGGKGKFFRLMAGGWAAGKTYALRNESIIPDLNWDGTLSDRVWAANMIELALKHHWRVEVAYIYRNLELAMYGALERAKEAGRVVPLAQLPKNHRDVQNSVLSLTDLYGNRAGVSFLYLHNLGKQGSIAESFQIEIKELESSGALRYLEKHESYYKQAAKHLCKGSNDQGGV